MAFTLNRRKLRELIGETAREIGILVLVFAPLDALFQPGSVSFPAIGLGIALALFSMIFGVIFQAGHEEPST